MGQQIAERTAAARSEADAAKQELAALDQQSAALNQQIADRSAAAQKDADAAQQKLAPLDQQIAARTAAARTETDAAQQKLAALNQQIADRAAAASQGGDGGDAVADLEKTASLLGAQLVLADVALDDGTPRHDPLLLARAYAEIFREGSGADGDDRGS